MHFPVFTDNIWSYLIWPPVIGVPLWRRYAPASNAGTIAATGIAPHTAIPVNPIPSVPSDSTGTIAGNWPYSTGPIEGQTTTVLQSSAHLSLRCPHDVLRIEGQQSLVVLVFVLVVRIPRQQLSELLPISATRGGKPREYGGRQEKEHLRGNTKYRIRPIHIGRNAYFPLFSICDTPLGTRLFSPLFHLGHPPGLQVNHIPKEKLVRSTYYSKNRIICTGQVENSRQG